MTLVNHLLISSQLVSTVKISALLLISVGLVHPIAEGDGVGDKKPEGDKETLTALEEIIGSP